MIETSETREGWIRKTIDLKIQIDEDTENRAEYLDGLTMRLILGGGTKEEILVLALMPGGKISEYETMRELKKILMRMMMSI